MHPIKSIAFRAAVAALLAWPVAAQALEVGKLSVSHAGPEILLKVATDGEAQPQVSIVDGDKALIVVPGGTRKIMGPLKVNAGILKGIRFGAKDDGLHIVMDLKQAGTIKLGTVGAKGFDVSLAAAKAPAAAAKADAVDAAPEAAAAKASDPDVSALNPASAAYTYRIIDLALGGDSDQGELVISSDGPASYKSSLKDDGKLLSLTFRNSSLAWAGDGARLTDSSVSGVSVRQLTEGGESVVKVDVRLREKLAYNLKRDENQLVVRLGRPETVVEEPHKGDMQTPVSLDVEDADIISVLKALCQQAGFEYQFTATLLAAVPPASQVTLRVKQRPFEEVLSTILSQATGAYVQEGNTLYIGTATEVADRRGRMPSVERFYAPKYLPVAQLTKLLAIRFSRDPDSLNLTNMLKADPSDGSRFMLVGTGQELSQVMAGMAAYDVPDSSDAAASDDGGGGGKPRTQVFHLQYLDPVANSALITQAIAQLFTDTGDEVAVPYIDGTTRTMVITTKLSYLRKIEKLLARIDVKQDQVNIAGKIVEVDQGLSSQLGIDWSANSTQPSGQIDGNGNGIPQSAGLFNTQAVPLFNSQLSFATLVNGYNIQAHLQALVAENKADLVSSPNITVNDNQQATITTADVLYSETSVTTFSTTGPTTAVSFVPQNIPLTLKVTPRISKGDRRVLMAIHFDLTSPSGVAQGANAPVPTSQQVADTSVNVNNGDTAVIGGLVRQSDTSIVNKVPVLGDIPLLGLLFKFTSVVKSKKEVIIFITPTIVED